MPGSAFGRSRPMGKFDGEFPNGLSDPQAKQDSEEYAWRTGNTVDADREMVARVTSAVESERRRLTVHLHDGVGQLLAAAQIQLEPLMASAPNREVLLIASEVKNLIEGAIAHTRVLTSDLSPELLLYDGLGPAVSELVGEMSRQCRLKVRVRGQKQLGRISKGAEMALYQSLRELLLNVAKHAGVATAVLTFETSQEHVRAIVEDHGCGFIASLGDKSASSTHRSLGLSLIRERLRRIGGTLTLRTLPDKGTTACLQVPRDHVE